MVLSWPIFLLMSTHAQFILTVAQQNWRVETIGNARRALIFFPGFGTNPFAYSQLIKYLKPHFTILFVYYPPSDPHLHSHSLPPIKPHQLFELTTQIIHHSNFEEYYGLGHSFGGRLMLYAALHKTSLLNHYLLIAPDGIATAHQWWTDRIPFSWRNHRFIAGGLGKVMYAMAKQLHKLGYLNTTEMHWIRKSRKDANFIKSLGWAWRCQSQFPIEVTKTRNHQTNISIVLLQDDPWISYVGVKKWVRQYLELQQLGTIQGQDHFLRRQETNKQIGNYLIGEIIGDQSESARQ